MKLKNEKSDVQPVIPEFGLSYLGYKDLEEIFSTKKRDRGLIWQMISEFTKFRVPAMEVDWQKIDRDFATARKQLSTAVGKIRRNPGAYDLPKEKIEDIGTKSLPKQRRVFLYHKNAEEIIEILEDNKRREKLNDAN